MNKPALPPGWTWSEHDYTAHADVPRGPRRVGVYVDFREAENGALKLTIRTDCAWVDEVEQVVSGAIWGIDTACPNASQHDAKTYLHPGPLYPAWRAVGRALIWSAVLLRAALRASAAELTHYLWRFR